MFKLYKHQDKAIIGIGLLSASIVLPTTALPIAPSGSHQCAPQVALIPTNVAVILQTASTNTDCKRFLVTPTGKVSYVIGHRSGQGNIQHTLASKFFADIKAAEPLSKLPVKTPCIKSVSFGTSTFVTLGNEKSPDLSCPGNVKAKQLFTDAITILGKFH